MRQRSIQVKLLLCFGLILMGSAVLIAVSVSTIRGLRSSIDTQLGPAMNNLDRADQIATKMADMRASLRGLITFTLMKRAEPAEASRKAFTAAVRTIESLSTQLDQSVSNDADRVSIGKIRDGVHQWNELFSQAVALCDEGKAVEADAFGNDKVRPVIVTMQAAADAYAASQREQAAAAVAQAASDANRGVMIMALLGLCALAIGVVAVIVVNRVASSLRRIAEVVSTGSEQVEQASKEIESSSHSLAESSTEQAATIEETSASFHEINSLSRRNAENSRTASGVANDSSTKHTSAEQLLEDMVSSMQMIKESSRKVATVLKVVDDIAFQTNILALNAAVEAARAGEAGLGFAVVADEVRNLAQKCAQAAKETTALIEESVAMSETGGGKADQVAKAIQDLMVDASQIKTLITQVQTASEEQAAGTDQIASAIHSIQEVTQRIAAQAEESAASSKHLRGQSERLNEAVEELATMANGTNDREAARA
jgi:methyl-accepting chemotaxis protein/methyl-accepting chemotaxis protein-1 (serine sensor receptor)